MRLTIALRKEATPHYTEKGRILYSAEQNDDKWQIYIMQANGRAMTRLTNNTGDDTWPGGGYGPKIQ